MTPPPRRPIEGALALVFYATHASWHLAHHRPADLLWACHVACLWIAIGFALPSPRANAIGLAWLSIGVPLWILDVARGGELIPTTFCTHLGGLALGLRGALKMGFPRGTAWRATLAMIGLQAITRLVTPAASNVNLAFAVHRGWESTFPDYRLYWLALLSLTFAITSLVERLPWPIRSTPSSTPTQST